MNTNHTVESMLKELKANLTRYENLLEKIEKFDFCQKASGKKANTSQASLDNLMKPDIDDIDKIKVDIEKNIKNITLVIVKDDQKFIFNKYKELNLQLDQRNKIFQKKINKINENKKLEKLLSNKKGLQNAQGIELLNEEHQSLNTCLQISEDMKKIVMNSEEELQSQSKTLKNNREKLEGLLSKFPTINKVLGSIKFHKYKEKIVLGIVIGAICFLGLYLTYY